MRGRGVRSNDEEGQKQRMKKRTRDEEKGREGVS